MQRQIKNIKVMDKNIAKGVNYDYILVLGLNCNQRLELEKVTIKRSISLIEKLYSYCEDRCFDIEDMFHALQGTYLTCKSFEYCLAHEYTASFINEVKFPELNVHEYRKEEQSFKEVAYQRIYRKLKFSHRDWTETELKDETGKVVEGELASFNQKKKDSYIGKCLNYIYSYDYNHTLSLIESSKPVISFSNERHGRFSYEHQVNEDLKIRICTNFCYGSASTFRVIITYKDIELLPYSIWVKYYYAGFSELLHCTRSYRVNRSNWDVCMAFVVDFVNSAIDDPARFIRKTVMQEVIGMMEGLRGIYKLGKDYLNKIMEMEPTGESEYVGVRQIRHCNIIERKNYSIYPNEMYLVYRIGKISGALRFLDSLKQLASICNEVDSYIEEIYAMNVSVYPEVSEAIPPIVEDVQRLEKKLKTEEKRLESLENRFEYLDNKLDKILSRCNGDEREKRKESFVKANPSYEKLPELISSQEESVNLIRRDMNTRNSFLIDLIRFKKLIEKYVELPEVA